jgi:hypothetical protein
MRKSIVILGAVLAAMLAPGLAQAQSQAQKPDAFVIEDNSMMGRSPRLPVDRLVADDTGGELIGVRGKAWWQVLMHCAGIYRYHYNQLHEAGDDTAADAAELTGKRFIGLAIDRLVVDREIKINDTIAILLPEANYGFTAAADGGETHRPFAVDEMRCRDVEQRYGEALMCW